MELRSNIKMLNYARKYLLNDTDNILPFPVRPQKPPRTGRLPTLLPMILYAAGSELYKRRILSLRTM